MTKNVANEKVQDYVKKSHNMTENEQKSEKNTQDVQKKCLSLTEAWRNGELEEGPYYVKLESGKIDIYFMVYDDDDCDEIVEVISPVLSYEEWLENESHCAVYSDINKWLKEENQKIKELLKECRETIEKAQKNYGYDDSIVEILEPVTNKIDEVLK